MNKATYKILFLIALLASQPIHSIDIKGRTVNIKNGQTIAATITLLSNDSTLLSSTIIDNKGEFKIQIDKQKNYILAISALGYKQNYIGIKGVETDLNLGDILLEENTYELNEVSVIGKKIIRKIDRQIIFPTQAQIKASTDGLNLLSKMSPTHLRINNVKESVTYGASGQVMFQINGMKTDIKDILALHPDQVIRIEYYDHPGLQFGEDQPDAVLNYIIRRSKGGGVFAGNLRNAVNTGFGYDRITTKLNHKQSEFSLNYFFSYEHYKDRWSDQTTTYHFPEKVLEQTADGIKKPYEDINHNISLAYNLMNTEKYMFNAKFNMSFENWDNSFANVQTFIQYPDITKTADSKNKTKTYSPSVDLYYIRFLGKKQQITGNIVGTYFYTDYRRKYQLTDRKTLENNFENRSEGRKYSGIGEIAYKKSWDRLVLNVGANCRYFHVDNNYTGTTYRKIRIDKSHLYVYAQFSGAVKKLEYFLGVAGKHSYFSDSEHRYQFTSFLPKLKLSYNLSDNLSIFASGEIYTMDPPPGYLSNVSQPIDNFTIQKGNPDLKPYKIYKSELTLEYSKGIVSLTASAYYNYYHKPIVNKILYEEGKFINTFENQLNYKYTGAFIDFNFNIIKDKLTLYWTNAIDYFTSRGVAYHHKLAFFSIGATLNYYYKNWDFEFSAYNRRRTLWGEFSSIGSPDETISVGYKLKNIRLGAGVNSPFHRRWSAETKNLSRLTPSTEWTYIGVASPLFYLTFSWNINWGKKYEPKRKELNNQDIDAGILNIKDK